MSSLPPIFSPNFKPFRPEEIVGQKVDVFRVKKSSLWAIRSIRRTGPAKGSAKVLGYVPGVVLKHVACTYGFSTSHSSYEAVRNTNFRGTLEDVLEYPNALDETPGEIDVLLKGRYAPYSLPKYVRLGYNVHGRYCHLRLLPGTNEADTLIRAEEDQISKGLNTFNENVMRHKNACTFMKTLVFTDYPSRSRTGVILGTNDTLAEWNLFKTPEKKASTSLVRLVSPQFQFDF